jgi:hypothetical protein
VVLLSHNTKSLHKVDAVRESKNMNRSCLVLFLLLSASPIWALDTDSDTLPDEWEVVNGRNPNVADYAINTTCTKDENGGSCTPAISLAPYSYFVENVLGSCYLYGANAPGAKYYRYTPSLGGVTVETIVYKCNSMVNIYSQVSNAVVPASSLVQFYGIGSSFCFLDNNGKKCYSFNGSTVSAVAASMFIDSDHDGVQRPADVNDLNAMSDSDNDSIPDYIDADPLNAAVNTEVTFPVNGGYKGSAVKDHQGVQ